MIAGLYPHFTAVLAIRPAAGDMRAPTPAPAGWPMWYDWTQNKDPEKVRHASEYYDPANFAPDITCPVLVGLGLLDEVAAPSSVFATANRISSPKEIVIMPHATHQSEGEYQQTLLHPLGPLDVEPPPRQARAGSTVNVARASRPCSISPPIQIPKIQPPRTPRAPSQPPRIKKERIEFSSASSAPRRLHLFFSLHAIA